MEHLCAGITCHAWNKDKSKVAICPNTNEIFIYNAKSWKIEATLTEHDMIVSGLDWSPVHNMIVSCSHDRNAFVWKYDTSEQSWKPSLVLLRINRAGTNVKWSPDGTKFAVASGAKCVPVCYYEAANNWWISKMIKKHKSTVLDIDWHPNSQLIVTGSSDMKCRIFSAFISDLDGNPEEGPFGKSMPFGEPLAEFGESKGWVESVAWSPNGLTMAYTGHDASIHFVSFQGGKANTQTVRFRELPMQKLLFLSNHALIGAGHDNNILLFKIDSNQQWSYHDMLDKKSDVAAKTTSGGFSAAKSMWESKVDRGQSAGATSSDKGALWTKHESTITYLSPYSKNASGNITEFTSTALDGRLVFWKLANLSLDLVALQI